MGNQLFENRPELDQGKIKKNFKILLKGCADLALLLGKTNLNLLALRREKMLPQLNYNYWQLLFPPEDYTKLLFGMSYPKHLKKLQRSIKWDKL